MSKTKGALSDSSWRTRALTFSDALAKNANVPKVVAAKAMIDVLGRVSKPDEKAKWTTISIERVKKASQRREEYERDPARREKQTFAPEFSPGMIRAFTAELSGVKSALLAQDEARRGAWNALAASWDLLEAEPEAERAFLLAAEQVGLSPEEIGSLLAFKLGL